MVVFVCACVMRVWVEFSGFNSTKASNKRGVVAAVEAKTSATEDNLGKPTMNSRSYCIVNV